MLIERERERVKMKKLWSTLIYECGKDNMLSAKRMAKTWRRRSFSKTSWRALTKKQVRNCLSNGWLLALLAIFFLCQSPETGNCVLNILQPKPSEELPGKWLLCLHLGSLGLTGLQVNIRIFKRSNHKRPNFFLWALMEGADKDFEQQLTNMMTSLGCSRALKCSHRGFSVLSWIFRVCHARCVWNPLSSTKPSRFLHHLARYLPEFRELSGWPSNLGWLGWFWFWECFCVVLWLPFCTRAMNEPGSQKIYIGLCDFEQPHASVSSCQELLPRVVAKHPQVYAVQWPPDWFHAANSWCVWIPVTFLLHSSCKSLEELTLTLIESYESWSF